MFLPACCASSVGSRVQYDFEEAVHDVLGGMSYTFDPSLNPKQEAKMRSLPFLHFEPIGLAAGNDTKLKSHFPQWKFLTLMEMIAMTGRDYIDIVKIDCEGCEPEVLDELADLFTANRKPPFGQLCMEVHRWVHEAGNKVGGHKLRGQSLL